MGWLFGIFSFYNKYNVADLYLPFLIFDGTVNLVVIVPAHEKMSALVDQNKNRWCSDDDKQPQRPV